MQHLMSGNFDNPAFENGPKAGSFASDQKERHQSNRQISGTCWPHHLSVLQLLWYFLTPCFLLHQLLQL